MKELKHQTNAVGAELESEAASKLEFRINHERRQIECNDPSVFLIDQGGTPEPYVHYFTLHWHGREIPVRTKLHTRSLGSAPDGQPLNAAHWIIEQIGAPFVAQQRSHQAYNFESHVELMCAANIIQRALQTYGGATNVPEWNFFPQYSEITTEFVAGLKKRIYGDLN